MIVRAAQSGDAGGVAMIYAHHVVHGTGSFEETPPTVDEMAGRMAAVTGRGLPWVVAEEAGLILALAYAGPYRTRRAYRYTVEDSVYVAPQAQRSGLGRAALIRVIDACQALGLRQMIAVIGDSDNIASIALHRALGFEPAGLLPSAGFKAGRWIDVVLMRRALNDGDANPPDRPGLEI